MLFRLLIAPCCCSLTLRLYPVCALCIYREQTVDDKKKPEMLERIIAGKVNKRMAELCLLSQVALLCFLFPSAIGYLAVRTCAYNVALWIASLCVNCCACNCA